MLVAALEASNGDAALVTAFNRLMQHELVHHFQIARHGVSLGYGQVIRAACGKRAQYKPDAGDRFETEFYGCPVTHTIDDVIARAGVDPQRQQHFIDEILKAAYPILQKAHAGLS